MHSSAPAGLHQQKTADAIRHGMDRGLEEMLHMWMLCEPHRPQAYLTYVVGHEVSRAPQRDISRNAVVRPTMTIQRRRITHNG